MLRLPHLVSLSFAAGALLDFYDGQNTYSASRRRHGVLTTPAQWAERCAQRRAQLVATMPLLKINPRLPLGVLKALAGERKPRHAHERAAIRVDEAHAAMKHAGHMYADEIARDLLELAVEG